jgi:phosphohistidine phosphatase SixA
MMPAMAHSLTSAVVRVLFGVALMAAPTVDLRAQASADAPTTIFFVRHAEKSAPNGDVPLSAEGRARAATLAWTLKDAKVGVIFTSQMIRTKETAAPLAQQLHLTPQIAAAEDIDALVKKLKALPAGSVALVVHHSNTVPEAVTKLGAGTVTPIDDAEYDRLLIVTRRDGKTHVTTLRYGQPPPAHP